MTPGTAANAPANAVLDADQAKYLEEAWQEVQPDTARRLLIAAAQAFAAKGFHGTSTRDIASGAGMSPAGVYVHYRSKEELLYRITWLGHQQTLRMIRAATSGRSEPAEQLCAVIRDLTSWHARHHATARVVEYELPFLSEEHHAEIVQLRREIDALIRGILKDGVAQGVFHVPDVPTTTLALLSLSVDVARWYHVTPRLSATRLGLLYADLAFRMVSNDSPPAAPPLSA